MPRTPAPLTVEPMKGNFSVAEDTWAVLAPNGYLVALVFEEADARAFVALPALIEAARTALGWIDDEIGPKGNYDYRPSCFHELAAALAQADGPAPTEER